MNDFFIARGSCLGKASKVLKHNKLLIMFVLFIVWSNSPFNTLPIFVLD